MKMLLNINKHGIGRWRWRHFLLSLSLFLSISPHPKNNSSAHINFFTHPNNQNTYFSSEPRSLYVVQYSLSVVFHTSFYFQPNSITGPSLLMIASLVAPTPPQLPSLFDFSSTSCCVSFFLHIVLLNPQIFWVCKLNNCSYKAKYIHTSWIHTPVSFTFPRISSYIYTFWFAIDSCRRLT